MAELSDWGREHIRMVLSWFLGFLGADRFYDGQVGPGVLKLITVGGLGVWWLADAAYYTTKAGKRPTS
jgi:TM2 domain-containing membrane protein YozV